MPYSKDLYSYLKELERDGWTVTKTRRNSHYRIQKDKMVYFTGGTPSSPRALIEVKTGIRRLIARQNVAQETSVPAA